jgi:S1-C subfamily serine protease
MAWNAVKALERVGDDPKAAVIVLVGSGHVAYGLGIERQARTYFAGPIASVMAMPIADDKGVPTPWVRASYANFIWGVAREADSYWPSLGASTRAAENGRRAIIDVEKDTPAAAAGLQVGDVIASIDGAAIDNRETLNRVLAGYRWGDTPLFVVLRAGADVRVTVPLRRRP